MNLTDDHVIAERQLTFEERSSHPKDVRVLVGRPVQAAETEEYSCAVQILGVGDEKVRQIYGMDSMQALQLGLRFISEMLDNYRAGLLWLGNKDIGL
jgi:hypothetical protein